VIRKRGKDLLAELFRNGLGDLLSGHGAGQCSLSRIRLASCLWYDPPLRPGGIKLWATKSTVWFAWH
ncbi:MAG TPA: hypothetical protein VNL70_05215, partial [Tepidisphaeraceae bacterium]|nr:hypothetical protein [Tepidisphaeraceae bacterium]